MQGRRIYPQEDGHLHLAEGDYGFDPGVGHWVVRPPGCHAGGIPDHGVVEHEDGTITVTPSIVLEDVASNNEFILWDVNEQNGLHISWHGYLEHGVWREV